VIRRLKMWLTDLSPPMNPEVRLRQCSHALSDEGSCEFRAIGQIRLASPDTPLMDNQLYAMDFCASRRGIASFFGAEPKLEYPKVPYKLNVIEVEADLSNGHVWFKYMPSQGWAELRVVARPFSVVKLLLEDISQLRVTKTKEDHFLSIRFARAKTSDLTLWLRPQVLVFWGNQGPSKSNNSRFRKVGGS